MQDIKKPYSRSKSSRDNIASRVEQFERRTYSAKEKDDEEFLDFTEKEVSIPIKLEERKSRIEERDIYPKNGERFVYRDVRTKYPRQKNSLNTTLFIVFLVAVVGFVGLSTYVFDSATVKFVPKFEDLKVNKSFVFGNNKEDKNTIYYELATSTLTKSKVLPLSETKKVEAKASGKIIIYNNYDTAPQKLIKNTRFESSEGKIFRINESITVPGKKGDIPGSLEVTVYADSYGADYNIPPSDFTVPGFKNSSRYKSFFARSNGGMSGGASGNAALVSMTDLNSAKDELALELERSVKNSLKEIKREGFVGAYDGIQILFTDNEQDLKIGKSANYEVTATGYLMMVDKNELAEFLASLARDYANEKVKLGYEDTLHFTLKDSSHLDADKEVEALVTGGPRIIWVNDEKAIKEMLMGKKKEEFVSVMKSVYSVEKAEINFSPVWLSTFPNEESSINFVENVPKR